MNAPSPPRQPALSQFPGPCVAFISVPTPPPSVCTAATCWHVSVFVCPRLCVHTRAFEYAAGEGSRKTGAEEERVGRGARGRTKWFSAAKEGSAQAPLSPVPPVLHKHEPPGAAAQTENPRISAVTAKPRCRRPSSVPPTPEPFRPSATACLNRPPALLSVHRWQSQGSERLGCSL